ncbi:peptidoglycan DD-metalloendopeptidase family protein [Sneathiella marina]|uniref:Peptidoglycan DD-metalloendopeptidase family protein n=1 Tax=Sneathiella marina TaxID=2950108 RepID=A0ABY4W1G1_9PROT|nr:peptidoglycan DD-metalloendopeptidase family protein [Sneathiella marina]USG60691.1 peptidoglycan DD-metalloendopeptidase family protein [Sneathiella marina]
MPVAAVLAGGIVGAVVATTFMGSSNEPPEVKIAAQAPQIAEKTPEQDQVQLEEKQTNVAVAAYAQPQAPTVEELTKTVSVGKGDTLMKVLTRAGADRSESHQAIAALTEVFDPRDLKIGQDVTLQFSTDDADLTKDSVVPSLMSVSLNEAVDRQLAAIRTPGAGFTAQETVLELDKSLVRAGGVIQNSLFLTAAQAGIPTKTIIDLIRIFSYDVDFQREIQPGDSFEVYFERFSDDTGRILKDGAIHWATMTLSGKEISVYRFKTADDGFTDYYDAKGRSVKKTLMRTPIDGARLTSGFGKRKHPTLGYTKMHRGVDFGARSGTPIMAAGNGVVEVAGRNGGYGNYVRIRHNGSYKTAYAHMKKFAKGVRKGSRVKQGQIIGYVGTTGRSTGPHLHYEVHRGGKQINPLSVKLPAGRKLGGKMLTAFREHSKKLNTEVANTALETQLASSD